MNAGSRGLLIPSIAALIAGVILIGLGTWQIERKAWKEALIATMSARLAAEPVPLPAPRLWPSLDPAEHDLRRVTFTAELLFDREALVYAAGSALRTDVSGLGYWVLVPARLPGGETVVVNRGFVPDSRRDPATRAGGRIAGPITILGAMRWPEQRGLFTPADDPGKNLWFVRAPSAIAAAKGWGAVAPFLVEQEAPAPPGGLPHPAPLHANLPNNHLQYALTWYGLAVVLMVAFAAFARSEWRQT